MIETILTATVPAAILTIVAQLASRKKHRAEIESIKAQNKATEVQNKDLAFEVYRKLLDDVNARMDHMTVKYFKAEEHFLEQAVDYRRRNKEISDALIESNQRIVVLETKVEQLSHEKCLVLDCARRIHPRYLLTNNEKS